MSGADVQELLVEAADPSPPVDDVDLRDPVARAPVRAVAAHGLVAARADVQRERARLLPAAAARLRSSGPSRSGHGFGSGLERALLGIALVAEAPGVAPVP
jgi:hypothetical protein